MHHEIEVALRNSAKNKSLSNFISMFYQRTIGVRTLGQPLLCRLGFHKWQDYGKQVEVFWREPKGVGAFKYSSRYYSGDEMHSRTVYEKCLCKRCGAKVRRKFVTNSDGTMSCVGWEPDTEEAH